MKSILVGPKEQKDVRSAYPWLGIFKSGNVVLFSKKNCGTLVHVGPESDLKAGHYGESWAMHDFEPLKGKITLSN